jgi:thymidine phosphorylase
MDVKVGSGAFLPSLAAAREHAPNQGAVAAGAGRASRAQRSHLAP